MRGMPNDGLNAHTRGLILAWVFNMSRLKLGLAVAWPAFWTGVPLKLAIVLVLLAMGVRPWEMPGLAFLLTLSVPIDIWALSVSAKTVFLERLRIEPPEGLGLTLWWQSAVLSALYLPIAYFLESQTIAMTKAVASRLMEFMKELPVSERISIELVLWGSPATIVLLGLLLGWLYGFGWLVQRQTEAGKPSEASLSMLVRRWDSLRVPRDQPLMLTILMVTGTVLVMLWWAFMPVTTPSPHELYAKPAPPKAGPPRDPAQALRKTEQLVSQAESALAALEAKAATVPKEKPKEKEKGEPGKRGGTKEGMAEARSR